jgi:hypothetical protein
MSHHYSALSTACTDEQSSASGHACDADDELQALKAELEHERRRTAELRAELGVSRHARGGHQVPAEGGTLRAGRQQQRSSAGHRSGGDDSDSDTTGSGRRESGAREPRASSAAATSRNDQYNGGIMPETAADERTTVSRNLPELIRVCKAEPIPLEQLEDILRAFPDACDALVDKVAVRLKTGGTGHTTALHEICKNQALTIKALEVALRHGNTRELLHTQGDSETYETPFALLCNNEKINKSLLRVASGGDVEQEVMKPAHTDTKRNKDTLFHLLCANPKITPDILDDFAYRDAKVWLVLGLKNETPLHRFCGNVGALQSVGTGLTDFLMGSRLPVKAWSERAADGSTPLHELCKNAKVLTPDCVASLFKLQDSMWEVQDNKEQTALHVLCELKSSGGHGCKVFSSIEKVDTLISQHLWRIQDKNGYRPFDLLCMNPLLDHCILSSLICTNLLFLWEPVSEEISPLHMLCLNLEALNACVVQEIGRMLDMYDSQTGKTKKSLLCIGTQYEDLKHCREDLDEIYRPQTKPDETKHCFLNILENVLQVNEQKLKPLHVLFAACKHIYLKSIYDQDQNAAEGGAMFKVAVDNIPDLADLMHTTQDEQTSHRSEKGCLLQQLLEEIYETDQESRSMALNDSSVAMSVDWLMARALWEYPRGFDSEKSTVHINDKNQIQDPLLCAIKIQASVMIENIVEQLLERKMLRFVRDLVKDIEALCNLGGDIAGLVFRLLDEGGIYQVPMPCYHFPAEGVILDGTEYETIGASERHRWLEYQTFGQSENTWQEWDPDEQNQITKVSLVKDRRNSVHNDSDRVAKVLNYLPPKVQSGYIPECKWLDGSKMQAADGNRYQREKLRIVNGPHESWRTLGKRCGVSWQGEEETQQGRCKTSRACNLRSEEAPVKDNKVSEWKLMDKATNRTSVEPAILAVEGAGQSDQAGLLHILVHHVDNGNIDCKVFGTEAVKVLVTHKWKEYGCKKVTVEILLHFIMVIAPWTGITWAVAHIPTLDEQTCHGCQSWLFYGLSATDARVAIILCFAAAFCFKAATRSFNYASPRQNQEPKPKPKLEPQLEPEAETRGQAESLQRCCSAQHEYKELNPSDSVAGPEREVSEPEAETKNSSQRLGGCSIPIGICTMTVESA